MGSQFSKITMGNNPAPPVQTSTANAQYTEELCSYEAACRLDPKLQSFDVTIQRRTNRAINSLSEGVEFHSVSFDSLREVTSCLLQLDQEVAKVILECKKDIWKNQEMFDLVKEYFENSLQTLDFCTALKKCIMRARDSQFSIQVALQRFEEELKDGDDTDNAYTRTLQELKKFETMGDPFTDEFFAVFQSVHKQQILMLQKLRVRRKKIDKNLKSLKAWRTVSNILFVAAFTSVLIFSVVAAVIALPPLVTALVGALAAPIDSVGKWINSLWKGYEDALQGQQDILSSMQLGTYIAIKDLEIVRVLVNKLDIEMESLQQNAKFALREPDAVKPVIDEIKKNLSLFMETIETLSDHAYRCSQEIMQARTVVLQRIIKTPSGST